MSTLPDFTSYIYIYIYIYIMVSTMVVISYEVDVRFVKLTLFGFGGRHLCQRRRRFDCLVRLNLLL